VLDIIYVVGTVVFFAIMAAYVRGCEVLGHRDSPDETR